MPIRHILILASLVILTMGASMQEPTAATAPPRVEIDARRFTYQPDTVTLKAGKPVLLVLKSEDVTHGLRIRELGLDMKASKKKPDEVLFTPQKTGDFVGHCTVFCGAKHGTMKIGFHIVN